MVVVAVKEPPELLAMHGIVGRVEVQNQPLRGLLERGDELLQQQRTDPQGRFTLRPVLQPAQRGGTGQGLIGLHGRLKRRIVPQGVIEGPPSRIRMKHWGCRRIAPAPLRLR